MVRLAQLTDLVFRKLKSPLHCYGKWTELSALK